MFRDLRVILFAIYLREEEEGLSRRETDPSFSVLYNPVFLAMFPRFLLSFFLLYVRRTFTSTSKQEL